MNILKYPHPILRQIAKPVEAFDDALALLADEMLKAMYGMNALGLSGPQVGQSICLIVIDVSAESDGPLVLVNPTIDQHDESKQSFEEGCLSFPGLYQRVTSFKNITVSYQDVKGEKLVLYADGLKAVAIQHEIDHLKGVLFIDRMTQKIRNKVKVKAFKGTK